MKSEIGAGSNALCEDADVERVEVCGNFGGRNTTSRNDAVIAIGVEERLPVMRGADDEKHGVGKTIASCEKCVDDEIDAGKWTVIADVADDEFIFEAEFCAKGADLRCIHAAKTGKICTVGKRESGDAAISIEFFAERLGDGEERIHVCGNAAEVFTNCSEARSGDFVLRKPIHDIECGGDFRKAIDTEEFRSKESVGDFLSFENGGESGAIARLAEREGAGRAEDSMEKDGLPGGEFDGSEAGERWQHFLRMESGGSGDGKLSESAAQGRGSVHVESVTPFENKDVETRSEAASKFDFADGDIFRIDMWNDEKARPLRGLLRCRQRRAHFSTRYEPMTRASIPELKKVRIASVGVWTMASPRRLKLVFMMTGTPVIFPNSSMRR